MYVADHGFLQLDTILQANKVNLQHIESRPDKIDLSKYEFIVEIKAGSGDFKRSCTALREFTTDLQILTRQRNRTTSSGSDTEGIIACHSAQRSQLTL